MPKKDNTILYVAGAAGLAYLILRKPVQTIPPAGLPAAAAPAPNLISQGISAITSLFKQSQSAIQPAEFSNAGDLMPVDQRPTAKPISINPITPLQNQMLAINPGSNFVSGIPFDVPGTGLMAMGCAALAGGLLGPGAIGKTGFDWTKLIVPGVVIAGGYLLAKNLGLLNGASATNNTAISQQTAQANNAALNSALNQGYSKTLSDAQYNSIATDIFNQGQSFTGSISSRAMDQIVRDFMQMHNIADVLALKIAFGVKELPLSFWSSCQWLNINCTAMDLDTFTKLNLDADHIAQINNYFNGLQIAYQL